MKALDCWFKFFSDLYELITAMGKCKKLSTCARLWLVAMAHGWIPVVLRSSRLIAFSK